MEAGFDSVRAEIKRLREEFKHEIVQMKHGIRSLKQSITFMQDEVDTLKEKAERNMKEMKHSLEEVNKKIVALELEDQLNAAVEKTSSSIQGGISPSSISSVLTYLFFGSVKKLKNCLFNGRINIYSSVSRKLFNNNISAEDVHIE